MGQRTAITIAAIVVVIVSGLASYAGYRIGFDAGYKTGVEEVQCDGGTHVTNPFQR